MQPVPTVSALFARIGWLRPFTLAHFLFALGCGLLVPEVVAHLALGSPALDLVHWLAILLMALWAWPVDLLAVAAFFASRDEIARAHRFAAVLVVVGTLAGLWAGLFTLPRFFSTLTGGYVTFSGAETILYTGYFAYVPTVFVPILLGHAALAVLVSRSSRAPGAREGFVAGAILLVLVAGVSLVVQLAGALTGWAWGLVGLAVPGYYVIATAARQEARGRASAEPWLRRGGRSPDSWP